LRHAVGHVIDLAPTILKLAGGSWPKESEGLKLPVPPGRDLAPTFKQDVAIDRDCIWWLHDKNRAIRRGDWKLVAAHDEQWQLYDLAKDRAENKDLAATDPEKAKELAGLWQKKLVEFQELARANTTEKPKSKNRATKKKVAPVILREP
jgi:arylsulfatase